MKTIFATTLVATTVLAGAANATPYIESSQPMYRDVPVTETVKVCEDVTVQEEKPGFSLEGAILGGIIGNNIGDGDGNGAAGAVLGGLIGGSTTETRVETRCHEETRVTGHTQELVGYNLVINVDGKKYYITVRP